MIAIAKRISKSSVRLYLLIGVQLSGQLVKQREVAEEMEMGEFSSSR